MHRSGQRQKNYNKWSAFVKVVNALYLHTTNFDINWLFFLLYQIYPAAFKADGTVTDLNLNQKVLYELR